jgi:membrane-associated phospholipid phosphatase
VASCLALVCWGTTCAAAADDGEVGLRWNPRWTRFTATQYVLTTAMGGGLFASNELLHGSARARWQSDVLLDRQARSLFAAKSERGRELASTISDHMRTALVLYPFVMDALLVAGIVHGSPDVALQVAAISLQGMLLAKLVTALSKELAGRARPDAGECQTGSELACGKQNESFISGHTSGAFAGAGLICAHHEHLRLYGSQLAGMIACGTSLGLATTVGTLRMVASRHHLSDVLAGAVVGFASGYLLPNLTNYGFGGSHDDSGTLIPIADVGTLGLAYTKTW